MLYSKLSALSLVVSVCLLTSCDSKNNSPSNEPAVKGMSHEEMVQQGKRFVTLGGCHDCHSPKKMTPQGPMVDSSQMLSGHPANAPLPPIGANATKPGNWYLMGPDVTAFVGPWGISYAANLTPDTATGLGNWSEAQFIQTLRTGKHLGMENGRPILPPMPWYNFAQLPDDDLKSIFAYLKSLPAVSNRVPGPVAPDKVMAK